MVESVGDDVADTVQSGIRGAGEVTVPVSADTINSAMHKPTVAGSMHSTNSCLSEVCTFILPPAPHCASGKPSVKVMQSMSAVVR